MMSELLHTLVLATASSSIAMLLALALRKPLRLRFGAAGHTHVVNHYSMLRYQTRYAELLARLAAA